MADLEKETVEDVETDIEETETDSDDEISYEQAIAWKKGSE
jgi:hypothetical protein